MMSKNFFQKDEFLYEVPHQGQGHHHLKDKVKESLYFQKIS